MATCLHPKSVYGYLRPCGQCPVCRQNYRQSKGDRFLLESAFNKKNGGINFFVTLTYDDDHLSYALPPNSHNGDWLPCFNKHDIDLLFHYLRRDGLKFRYFLGSEYGSSDDATHRPHYHLLFFLDDWIKIDDFETKLVKFWKNGFIEVSYVNESRVQYVCKYVLKDDFYYLSLPGCLYRKTALNFDVRRPFQLTSNGIGSSSIDFLNEYIFNDGENIREMFKIGKKSVNFDTWIKRHLDPSVKAELDKKLSAREDKIQGLLVRSRNAHSVFDEISQDWYPDISKDIDILKHREMLKKLKKKKL